MPKSYSQCPEVSSLKRRAAAVAAVIGLSVLAGCEASPPASDPMKSVMNPPAMPEGAPSIASYVDCKKEPYGTSRATAQPGRAQTQQFGEAVRQADGTLRWLSQLSLVERSDRFSVAADGFGPVFLYDPPASVAQSRFVAGSSFHIMDGLPNPATGAAGGTLDGDVLHFNPANPQDPANQIVLTWHCGTPLSGPMPTGTI